MVCQPSGRVCQRTWRARRPGARPAFYDLSPTRAGQVLGGRLVGDLDVVAPLDQGHVGDLVDLLGVGDPEVLAQVLLGELVVTLDPLLQGLADFAVVQSYLSTAAHWGITRFQALHRLYNGDGPWIPTTLTPPAVAA